MLDTCIISWYRYFIYVWHSLRKIIQEKQVDLIRRHKTLSRLTHILNPLWGEAIIQQCLVCVKMLQDINSCCMPLLTFKISKMFSTFKYCFQIIGIYCTNNPCPIRSLSKLFIYLSYFNSQWYAIFFGIINNS